MPPITLVAVSDPQIRTAIETELASRSLDSCSLDPCDDLEILTRHFHFGAVIADMEHTEVLQQFSLPIIGVFSQSLPEVIAEQTRAVLAPGTIVCHPIQHNAYIMTDDFLVDLKTYQYLTNNDLGVLGVGEALILKVLYEASPGYIGRERLKDLTGYTAIKRIVYLLRRKLEPDPPIPRYILHLRVGGGPMEGGWSLQGVHCG